MNKYVVWVDDPKEGWYLEGTYSCKDKAYSVVEGFEYAYVEEMYE